MFRPILEQGCNSRSVSWHGAYDRENSKAIDIEGMVTALSQVLEDLLARDKKRGKSKG